MDGVWVLSRSQRARGVVMLAVWLVQLALLGVVWLPHWKGASMLTSVIVWPLGAYFCACLLGSVAAVHAGTRPVVVRRDGDGAVVHVRSWFMAVDGCFLVPGWWRAGDSSAEGTGVTVLIGPRARYAVKQPGVVVRHRRAAALLCTMAMAPGGRAQSPRVAPPRDGGVFALPVPPIPQEQN